MKLNQSGTTRLLATASVGLTLTVLFLVQRNGPAEALASAGPEPIGLSLFFQNSQIPPLTLVGDAPRYLQEIDITAAVTTSTDEGINPLIQSSEFASLDWSGVTMVEEDWRSSGDGKFTRQRFYRQAQWMEHNSQFILTPTDSAGNPVGEPLIAHAGKDDQQAPSDDGFVRRFVARQIATGCPDVGDCTGATFTAQGLVQLRDALRASERAQLIPPGATRLSLKWTAQNQTLRTVEVNHAAASDFPFGYGFQISLEPVSTPLNGSSYQPGEEVTFRLTYRDAAGNRLHPPGSLPTFGQFLRGEITSGLRYFDVFLGPTTYYALKHRESNLLLTLSGPTSKLRTSLSTVGLEQFFLPFATVASTDPDGFTAIASGVPPFPVLFGGLFVPAIWETPVSDQVSFIIPSDAEAGTYVVATKARREFGGQALNRGTTTTIQVGTATPTIFTAKTGNCNQCHTGPSSLGSILHGLTDRSACYSCHASLATEPDAALDIRVHMVHGRSARFPGNVNNCATCHLTPPEGPARGLIIP